MAHALSSDQRLDFLRMNQNISRVLTRQHIEAIAKHFGLPAAITTTSPLWGDMRMRGKFSGDNVWDLREFLVKLHTEKFDKDLAYVINELSYYHNKYRSWQRNNSLAEPIASST